jgi:hypothetical protein
MTIEGAASVLLGSALKSLLLEAFGIDLSGLETSNVEYGVSGAVHPRRCPDGADSLNGPNWSVSDKIWLDARLPLTKSVEIGAHFVQ